MTVDVLSEGKSGALDLGTARAQKRNRIRDRHFLRELRRLRLLRSFETQVGELPTTEMPDSFGFLLQLRYAPWGRLPSKEEWSEVDRLTSFLFLKLSDPLRKRFTRSRISPFIAYLPGFLMAAACISLLLTVGSLSDARREIAGSGFSETESYKNIVSEADKRLADLLKESKDKDTTYQQYSIRRDMRETLRDAKTAFIDNNKTPTKVDIEALLTTATIYESSGTIILYYLIWLVSMGCIGAVAFIGMNAISAQDDITFDISNMRLMTLRVVLGGLFALVLALPFGSKNFIEFCYFIGTGGRIVSTPDHENSLAQVLMLIAPFLLGYSTSLVILALNQLINGVQAVFGIRSGTARETVPPGSGT